MSQRNPSRFTLRGARLYGENSTPVDVLVEGGVIRAVGEAGSLDSVDVRERDGLLLLPGVIDAHTHPIHDETFQSVATTAVAGGVTTTLQHLYPEPDEPFDAAVGRASAGCRQGFADYGFHIRITPDRSSANLESLAQLQGVTAVKSFLAYSDPSVMSSLGDLYDTMVRACEANKVVIVHAEFGEVLDRHAATIGPYEDLDHFQRARPDYLEAAAVHAVGALAQMTGAQAYIAHVSNDLTLSAARQARDRGARLLVETCPHYLFLDATTAGGGLGRVTPPLRSPDTVASMREAIAKGGLVDVLASDHCGYGRADKSEDVSSSGNGLPGIELMLPLMLDASNEGGWLSPPRVLQLLCHGPAEAFGLSDKGRIAPGFHADLVLVDPQAPWVVDGSQLGDASFYTPYQGRQLSHQVVEVVRRGEIVFGRDAAPPGGAAPVAC